MQQLLDIPKGWYPRFSPDGNRVTFGFGEVGVASVKAGGTARWYPAPPGQQMFQGGWLNNDEVVVILDPKPYDFMALNVTTGVLRLIRHSPGASSWEASPNGIGVVIQGAPFPLFWNGVQVAQTHLGCRVWKNQMISATPPPGGNWDSQRFALELWTDGKLTASFAPTVGQTNDFRIGEGWASWGYFGTPYMTPLSKFGELHQVAVMPPGGGEGPPYPFLVNGATWIVSGAENGPDSNPAQQLFMAVRPLGEKAIVKVPAPGIKPEAFQRGSDIIVAGESAKGHLTVWSFPISTPRAIVAPLPAPTPVPTPTPTPVPTPMPRPNHKDVVEKWAADAAQKFPVGPDRGFYILNQVCFELASEGYGLIAKTSGNNYKGFSVDKIIQRDGTGVDILTGPDNDQAAWSEIVAVAPDLWRAPQTVPVPSPPSNPGIPPAPTPVPPVTPPFDPAPLLAAMAALVNRLTAAETQLGQQAAQIAQLQVQITRLRVKGGTSRSFGHAHQIDLPVVVS